MNRTILVTGATSGMGADAVLYLADHGYSVVLVGRNEEKLQKMGQLLSTSCLASCRADLTDMESIAPLFADLKEREIMLDGLVYCAGADSSAAPVRTIRNENVRRLLTLHTEAFVEMCKFFYRRDFSNEGSSIVAISSLASLMCRKNSLDYSVSKAALNAAVKVMSREFLKRNIRVNAILPANVDTPMCDNLKKVCDITSIQPMGFIEPIHISYMIEYLLSDKAKYITGGLIPISAGMEY